jgi:hypothetical protein
MAAAAAAACPTAMGPVQMAAAAVAVAAEPWSYEDSRCPQRRL